MTILTLIAPVVLAPAGYLAIAWWIARAETARERTPVAVTLVHDTAPVPAERARHVA